MKKLGVSLLGLAVVLAWWHFHAGGGGGAPASKIPTTVFGGGGGTVTVAMDVSDPARVTFEFGKDPVDGSYKQKLTAIENVPAGHHEYTMDVAPATSAMLEVEAVSPKTGSAISWSLRGPTGELYSNQIRLDGPLGNGEAFFDNIELEDLVQGRRGAF